MSILSYSRMLPILAAASVARDAVEAPGPARSIVFIVADDLGFNDVSFHGSTQIPTPAIDELAHTGLVLDNYHAQPVCSPTRASLLSGRHAIHHGIYMPFSQGSALRLNLSFSLLPQYLKKLGYSTHAVGKWHLGQNELAALPTGRGFDSYYGYWAGAEDYVTHSTKGAYDLAEDTKTCFAANGTYSTYLFAARAVRVIEAAAKASSPFYLYLAFQNVHWPLEAPQASCLTSLRPWPPSASTVCTTTSSPITSTTPSPPPPPPSPPPPTTTALATAARRSRRRRTSIASPTERAATRGGRLSRRWRRSSTTACAT